MCPGVDTYSPEGGSSESSVGRAVVVVMVDVAVAATADDGSPFENSHEAPLTTPGLFSRACVFFLQAVGLSHLNKS